MYFEENKMKQKPDIELKSDMCKSMLDGANFHVEIFLSIFKCYLNFSFVLLFVSFIRAGVLM